MSNAAKKLSEAPVIHLGFDDGNYNSKIAGPNGSLFCCTSRGRHGQARTVALGKKQPDIAEFKVGNKHFSAGDVNSESTMSDAYPVSELSRVISHHALYRAGFAGATLKIATGLPPRLFFKGDTVDPDEDYIKRKVDNLAGPCELVLASPEYPNTQMPFELNIVEHKVAAEGMVAYFHLLLEEMGGNTPKFHANRQFDPFGFIDFGGRTTDIVVVSSGAVDRARSKSIPHGMLEVREMVRSKIKETYGLRDLSDGSLDRAMVTGRVKIFNVDHDISEFIASAKSTVTSLIRDEVYRAFGDGSELSEVVFFGGACVDFEHELNTSPWFPHQRTADEPLYVNALGLYKFIKYIC